MLALMLIPLGPVRRVVPRISSSLVPNSMSAKDSPVPGAGPIAVGPGGAGDGDGGGSTAPGDGPGDAVARPDEAFTVPGAGGPDRAGTIELDPGVVAFGGFAWAVPTLVLTVPGLLLILAVVAQALIGLAWLPVARRWLAGDRRPRGPLPSHPAR